MIYIGYKADYVITVREIIWAIPVIGIPTNTSLTIIEAVAIAVQPRAEPVTVYCMLESGLSVNELPVELSLQV